MTRLIKLSSTQMEVSPAPITERLCRAERLVALSAQAGAELVVLPELFNTGYAYSDQNFQLAETIPGYTSTWMREIASRLNVHVAGTILIKDANGIFDSLLLCAPDGQIWRYDKQYPWGWERAYFGPNKLITIAHTNLGDIGLMICWDVAHRNLWKRYAGLVDLLVISSSPPDVTNLKIRMPNGEQLTMGQGGLPMSSIQGRGKLVFDEMLSQQTAWIGVPAVCSAGCGIVNTPIPNAKISLLSFVPAAPRLISHLRFVHEAHMVCDMIPCCKIVASDGRVIAQLSQAEGENIIASEITLADSKPQIRAKQPKSPLPWLTYGLSDYWLSWFSLPVYQKGLRLLRDRIP